MQGDSWRPARGRRPDRHSRRAARCPHGTHKPCGPARGSGPESDSTWATHDSSATRRHLRRVPKRGALTARRLNILWPQSAPTRRPRVRAAVRVDCGLPPERRATPSWRSTLCGWPLKTPGPYAPTDRTLVTALRAYGPSAPNRHAEPPSPRSAIAPVVRRTGRRARRPAPTSRVCGGPRRDAESTARCRGLPTSRLWHRADRTSPIHRRRGCRVVHRDWGRPPTANCRPRCFT